MKLKIAAKIQKIGKYISYIFVFPLYWFSGLFRRIGELLQSLHVKFGHWLLTKTNVFYEKDERFSKIDLESPYLTAEALQRAINNGII